MLGAICVANVLIDHAAPVNRDLARRMARPAKQETGKGLLKRFWRGLALAFAPSAVLLPSRSVRVPGLDAEIARLRETSPHLLVDIGIDPVTGASIPPAIVEPEPAPEVQPVVVRPVPLRLGKVRASRPVPKRVTRPTVLRMGTVARLRGKEAHS
jgi:hypothetical protein